MAEKSVKINETLIATKSIIHRAAQSLGELHGGIRRRNGSMGNPEDELREMQKFGVTAGPEEWVQSQILTYTLQYVQLLQQTRASRSNSRRCDRYHNPWIHCFSTFLFSWVDWASAGM